METNATVKPGVTDEAPNNLELTLSTAKPCRLILQCGTKTIAIDLQTTSLNIALHIEGQQSIPLLEFRYPAMADYNHNNCKVNMQDSVFIVKLDHTLAKYKEIIDIDNLPKNKIVRAIETIVQPEQPQDGQDAHVQNDMATMIQNFLGPLMAGVAAKNNPPKPPS